MITWMQRHKKWLIVTIWISTIAFVGAGFVGWGAYDFGKSQGSVAKVGVREISMNDLQQEYSSMYNQYQQMFGEAFNDEAAKKMGLENVAMQSLIQKNLYLSYADELGITSTDEEVAKQVMKIEAFKKDGKFDKETYITLLSKNKTNPTEFEKSLKDGILLEKVKLILSNDINLQEVQNISKLFFLEDTIKMEIINKDTINVTPDEASLKAHYEKNKDSFKTPNHYELAITELAMDADQNKSKEMALKEFLKLKKQESTFQNKSALYETTLPFGAENNQKIIEAKTGDVLKPFIANGKYTIVKIEKKTPPQTMSYEQAKPLFIPQVIALKKDEMIKRIATSKQANFAGTLVANISRDSIDKIPGLSQSEAGSFLNQLFSATSKKGYILLDNKAVVYEIVESKFGELDNKKDLAVHTTLTNLKDSYKFEKLLEKLQSKYEVVSYTKAKE